MRRAVGDELGMLLAEGFRDMAIPADRPVGGQNLLKIFYRNFVPLDSFALRVKEGGRMIVPVDFTKGLVTENAGFSSVPMIDDAGDQARFRIIFDL
jgi:hypothetical protein